jgi:hypothetical protein
MLDPRYHNHVSIVATVAVIFLLVSVFSLTPAKVSEAQAVPGIPFGGRISFLIPPIPVFCTSGAIVIVNFYPLGPQVLTLVPVPGTIKLYGNIVTIGVAVLGMYQPVPAPTCPLAFPTTVIGTSLTP